jgi:hypothetical protein
MEHRGVVRRLKAPAALLCAPLALLVVMGASSPASAQQSVGVDPGRDCQTILTCNYSRRGSYRGCLSSYTCRVCRPQLVRCTPSDLASGRTRCTELVCTWGG